MQSYYLTWPLQHAADDRASRDIFTVVYQFCKLAAPAQRMPLDKLAVKAALNSPPRCPWAGARLLNEMGAFDFWIAPRKQLAPSTSG